jgi:enterochelin esterase family protein
LETLKQELAAGNAAAIDAFWQKVSKQGTPLIEPIIGDDQNSLVTFVWRAGEDTEGVEVVSNLAGHGDSVDAMALLPGTDLWYKTFKVHNETRESYQFAIDGNHLTDPLNPSQHIFHDDEEIGFTGWKSSVLLMPEAPLHPWSTTRPEVAKGQIDSRRIHSKILDIEYRVWVYTPPGYTAQGAPYGFLLILDGWFYLHLIGTPTILDNLLADGLLPPLVSIMVGSPFNKTRQRDLSCYPPFADFLTQELLPWARHNYHLSDSPARTAVIGSSRGGLMAAYMGLHHSDIFSNIISQAGAFGWRPQDDDEDEWLARQYITADKLPLHFYLDAGLLDTATGLGELGRYNFLVDARHMRNVLRAKGYTVHYAEYHGGHNPMNWPGTLPHALQALLGKGE